MLKKNINLEDKKNSFQSFNMESFLNDKINILLITGFSGSGKTTLAEKYEYKYNIVHIELDKMDPRNIASYNMVYNNLYEKKNQVFNDFLQENEDILDILKKSEKSQENVAYIMKKFIPYCIEWCKQNNYNDYSIEGVQIYQFSEIIDKNLPIIVMNTSAKESAERKYKRDLEYDEEITSESNIKKLEDFVFELRKKSVGDSKMSNENVEKPKYKVLLLNLDLIYKFKDNKKNRLNRCKFTDNSKGLMIVSQDEKELIAYITVENNKLTSFEIVKETQNDLFDKLVRLAIEKFGLNSVNVPSRKTKLIKKLQKIGFDIISNENDITQMKLKSIIIRKNDYKGLIVKRENGIDADTNENEFIYYFSEYNDGKQNQVGRVVLIPEKKYIVSIEIYEDFNNVKYQKILFDFATIEKGCINTRLVYGSKEKLELYEKYGFEITKKIKNSKGKFYELQLVDKVKFNSDQELSDWLQENITTCEFSKLMTSLEVEKQLCGSSHDQAQFILEKLPNKYVSGSILILEKNENDKILKSHTAVYYIKEGKYYWIENVLENAIGINGPFDSLDDLEMEIEKKFNYVNKKKDKLDFIPIYVLFSKPVTLEEYINSIISLEEC